MKVITDYFTRSHGNNNKVVPNQSQEETDNSDSDIVEYGVRKIKIRLADPNDPDSFICEVYDTSPSINSESGAPSSPLAGSPLPSQSTVGGSSRVLQTMKNTKRKRANLKRRRGLVKKTCETNETESESSSDEALISVRKRVKSSTDTISSATPIPDKAKITQSCSQRQSSEKENAAEEKCLPARTSRRLVAKKGEKAESGHDVRKNRRPCYVKDFEVEGCQEKIADNVQKISSTASIIKKERSTPVKDIASDCNENAKKLTTPAEDLSTPVKEVASDSNEIMRKLRTPAKDFSTPVKEVASNPNENMRKLRTPAKDLSKPVKEVASDSNEIMRKLRTPAKDFSTPVKEVASNPNENMRKLRTPAKDLSKPVKEVASDSNENLRKLRTPAKELRKTPAKEITSNESAKKKKIPKRLSDSEDKSQITQSRPNTRTRSVVTDLKSPDVKKEHIDRWRTSIKEQCSKLYEEAKDVPKVPAPTAASSSSQRRSGRTRTSSVPHNAPKSSDNNQKSKTATIKSFFGPPTTETPKPTESDDKEETSEDVKFDLSKTPIKESRVVLEKMNLNDDFTYCAIVDEKLNSDTRAKATSNCTKNGNLAPIFLKSSQKRTGSSSKPLAKAKKTKDIDPDILKARQAFLQSGVSIAKRKMQEVKKQKDNGSGAVDFPTVIHVQQRCAEVEWGPRSVYINLSDPMRTEISGSLVWRSLKLPCKLSQPIFVKRRTSDSTVETLKEAYKSVKIDGINQFLTERYREYSDATQELLPVWWDKYRPDSEQIVCNDRTVSKLTKWLTSWKLYNEEVRDGVLRRRRPSDCSSGGDDFVSSDDEGRPSRAPITACLLHGPSSSGKTALVHSVLNDLDLHILEVNASSKRSGKKMLTDLQEATQSHKILQESNGSLSRAGGKMSVIVVEEGDVVFEEHDEGFVSGLQNLISAAKRPIIIITSDVTSPYLEKFRTSETLQLSMTRPNSTHSCAIMELICLLEGVTPSRSSIMRLLNKNGSDLRRSLLELQFWGQRMDGSADPWPILSFVQISPNRLWWASHRAIFKSELWHTTPSSEKAEKDTPEVTKQEIKSFRESLLLKKYLSFAEDLSVCDALSKAYYPCSELSQRRVYLKDSISLEERRCCTNSQHERMGMEIAEAMTERIRRTISLDSVAGHLILDRISDKEARMISARKKASDELSEVVPRQYRDAGALDYLPALREMCRSESERVASNTKRGNRFYHYLRTLGGTPTQTNLQVNCESFYHRQPNKKPRKCELF